MIIMIGKRTKHGNWTLPCDLGDVDNLGHWKAKDEDVYVMQRLLKPRNSKEYYVHIIRITADAWESKLDIVLDEELQPDGHYPYLGYVTGLSRFMTPTEGLVVSLEGVDAIRRK